MQLVLPLFQDGKKLYERDLYSLAWYALGCARWTAGGGGVSGFVSPPAGLVESGQLWNGVEWREGALHVRPLFLLHNGLPLIAVTPTRIDTNEERLYAKLRVARKSEGLEVAYKVEFGWDGTNPDNKYAAVVVLAERRGTAARPEYALVPGALTPAAVPELEQARLALVKAVADFRDLLVRHATRTPCDRDLLMDRLERLAGAAASTPTADVIRDLRQTARAARGFFYRLRYHERPALWPEGQTPLDRLTGAVLEYQLEAVRLDPAAVELPAELRDLDPTETAADQLRALRDVGRALTETGALGRLLVDRSLVPEGEEDDAADQVIRRYDCDTVARVEIKLVLGSNLGNPKYAFADSKQTPTYFGRLPTNHRCDRTARYLFVSARRDTTVTVTPENN